MATIADRARAAAAATADVTETPVQAPSETKVELPASTPPGSAQEYTFSDSELADFLSDEDNDGTVPAPEPSPDSFEEDASQVGEEPTETILPEGDTVDQSAQPAGDTVETTPPTGKEVPETPKPTATPPVQATEQTATPGTEQRTPQEPAPKTPEELRADFEAAQSSLLQSLEQTYALSEDDVNAMITEPETVLPKLLARVHTNVLANMAQGMVQQLPLMIHQVTQQQQAITEYNRAFYSKWEALRGHEDVVNRFSQLYQQLNPGATMEQAISEIGAQVMVALRKPIQGHPQPVPAAGTAVTQQKSVPPPPPPARPGGSAPPKQAPVSQDNIFMQMAEEMEADGDI